MIDYLLFLPILASFFATLFFLPSWIRRAHKAGLVGKDMNKPGSIEVAEAGGVTVIAGIILGILLYISIITFHLSSSEHIISLFVILSVVLITAFIGMIDDILGWKIGLSKKIRIFLVILAAIPLIVVNAGESLVSIPILGSVNIGLIYTLLVIPLGVIGASTTFNFLAGYNGLEARQGILILGALAIASFFTGEAWLSVALLCVVCSLAAFLLFNSYPARIFPGDVMTYSIGALIASAAILGNLEKFAVFIFIPNIIEIILKLRGKLRVESFALPQKDGSLELKSRKIYSLSHFAIKMLKKYKQKVYERDVVLFINLFQVLVIILGFLIFKKGIFI